LPLPVTIKQISSGTPLEKWIELNYSRCFAAEKVNYSEQTNTSMPELNFWDKLEYNASEKLCQGF
jgi:hypothetical protein